MQSSIFARLIISYLMLFSILAGISLYFIYHLDQFNKITSSIILNDTLSLEYSNQLSDALLSESRNDRKYVVLKDENLGMNALKAGEEFKQLLDDAVAKASSSEIEQFFSTVGAKHQAFNRLVIREQELVRNGEAYSAERYEQQKKELADEIIDQLKNIRLTSEKNALNKIVSLNESGDKAKNVAIVISFIAFSISLLVTFIITRSIKKPLDVMRAKTIEISRGNFSGDLPVRFPAEIAELATAINIMCHELQEVDEVKTDFFSHMSHELRTPLTSIKVGTEMLLEGLGGELTEKQKHILSIVAMESNRLIELVNSLLDLSKMEAGMLTYQFASTDISILVKNALEAMAPLIEAKKISVDNRIGTLQPVRVDQERILQVLRNIIGNAIKFNEENGCINLRAHTGNNYIEVAVQDTGHGIPEGDLERIFVKFQQVISAKGEKNKGTGIGLATVKQIILAHGGKVWATSQVGKGSTLHITLPLAA